MRVAIATLFLCSLTVGCGGGGGGDGDGSLLSGSYHYLYLERNVAGDAVLSETGVFDANDTGGITFGNAYQTEEGAGAAIRRTNASYSVDGNRLFQWAGGFPTALHGSVSPGGSLGHACVRTEDRDPGMLVFARRDAAPQLSDLAGWWRLVEWTRIGSNPSSAVCAMAQVQITAAGVLTIGNYIYNRYGSINPIPIIFTSTQVEILGDGILAVRSGTLTAWMGGLSADGNLLLFGARDVVGGNAGVWLLVREGSAAHAGALQGEWREAGFFNAIGQHGSEWGSASFDGVGKGSLTSTRSYDGYVLPAYSGEFDYGVGVSGQVSIVGDTFTLGGGAGSGIVILAGVFTPGGDRDLRVLIP